MAERIISGLMSDKDIIEAINNHEMVITPFTDINDIRLTPSGFNFSFSRFIVSLNKKRFYEIYERDNNLYFQIETGDTALMLTHESIWVSNKIGGTFHSKVSYVAIGLGNVSTTLDPGWQGRLLISINNPNKKPIEILIGTRINEAIKYESFITLYLYKLATPSDKECLNKDSRLTDINKILLKGKRYKAQQKIISVIAEMINYMDSRIRLDLNKSCDIENDIKLFIQSHEETLEEWEKKYDEIRDKNKALIWRKRLGFILLTSVIFIILIIFLWGMFNKFNDENNKWLIMCVVSLIGAPLAKSLFDFLKKYYL